MMRRSPMLVAAFLACVTALTSAHAVSEASAVATAAGENRFTSSGATAVPLLVNRPFELSTSLPGVTLAYSGSWAGFFVVRQDSNRRPPSSPWMFGVLLQAPPAGCASHSSGRGACSDGHGLRVAINSPQSVSGRVGRFPAGRYVAYLLTSPGSHASATWAVKGWPGSMIAVGHVPVQDVWQATQTSSNGVSATHTGTAVQRLKRFGAFFDITWAATTPGTFESADWSLCVRSGTYTPLTGSMAGDYCSQTDGLAWFSGSPTSSFARPNTGAEYGQEIQTRSSDVSVEGLVAMSVKPGTYSVPYAVHVVGPSPQAGVSLLSWEYVY